MNKEPSVNKLGNGDGEAERAAGVVEKGFWPTAQDMHPNHWFRGTLPKFPPLTIESVQSFGSVNEM